MLSDADKAKITREFMDGSFYNLLLLPYIKERDEALNASAHASILKAEGDKGFVLTSGRLNELTDLVGQIKGWANSDEWPGKKKS